MHLHVAILGFPVDPGAPGVEVDARQGNLVLRPDEGIDGPVQVLLWNLEGPEVRLCPVITSGGMQRGVSGGDHACSLENGSGGPSSPSSPRSVSACMGQAHTAMARREADTSAVSSATLLSSLSRWKTSGTKSTQRPYPKQRSRSTRTRIGPSPHQPSRL